MSLLSLLVLLSVFLSVCFVFERVYLSFLLFISRTSKKLMICYFVTCCAFSECNGWFCYNLVLQGSRRCRSFHFHIGETNPSKMLLAVVNLIFIQLKKAKSTCIHFKIIFFFIFNPELSLWLSYSSLERRLINFLKKIERYSMLNPKKNVYFRNSKLHLYFLYLVGASLKNFSTEQVCIWSE